MKCKNCGAEIRWCEGCMRWEHCGAGLPYPARCYAKTNAEPEVIE